MVAIKTANKVVARTAAAGSFAAAFFCARQAISSANGRASFPGLRAYLVRTLSFSGDPT